MFDIDTYKFVLDKPLLWIDLVFSGILAGLLFYLLVKIIKNKKSYPFLATLYVILFVSWFIGLKFLWILSIVCVGAIIIIVSIQNPKELRALLPIFISRRKVSDERVFDRRALTEKIAVAVENLSKSKTGALITFEREDKFIDIIKSGTILHSPVTPELLQTIFYPGTRLHDGAVVISKDEILAASVYYTPTTKPLSGKYGSRHRAAIGISEVTDSVTVVVSEETGRISIAKRGELIPVSPDKVQKTLEAYLLDEE